MRARCWGLGSSYLPTRAWASPKAGRSENLLSRNAAYLRTPLEMLRPLPVNDGDHSTWSQWYRMNMDSACVYLNPHQPSPVFLDTMFSLGQSSKSIRFNSFFFFFSFATSPFLNKSLYFVGEEKLIILTFRMTSATFSLVRWENCKMLVYWYHSCSLYSSKECWGCSFKD